MSINNLTFNVFGLRKIGKNLKKLGGQPPPSATPLLTPLHLNFKVHFDLWNTYRLHGYIIHLI